MEEDVARQGRPTNEAPHGDHTGSTQRMSDMERRIRTDMMKVIDGRLILIEQKVESHHQETKELITQLLEKIQESQNTVVPPQIEVGELPPPMTSSASDSKRPWLKLRLQRFDNKLDQDSNYTLWRDKIRAEILANDCLCVFERGGKSRGKYNAEDLDSMKYCVRSFIIGHLGPFHHSLVQYTDDPIEMMALLDQAGQPLSKFGEYDLQDRLNHLKFEPSRESVLEFMKRFEDLVVELRRYITYSEEQAKRSLILAIKQALPAVYNKESNAPPPGLSIADIKRLMFDEENLTKEEKRRATQAQSTAMLSNTTQKSNFAFKKRGGGKAAGSSKWPTSVTVRCEKCGVNGHSKESCTNKGWKCYKCQYFTTSHYSKNCPYSNSSAPQQNQSTNAQTITGAVKRLGKSKFEKHKGMKRVPLWKAKIAMRAHKNTGQANLTVQTDSETEDLPEEQQCVWMDDNEFIAETSETLYADASDTSPNAALAFFDSKFSDTNVIRFIADSGATDHIVNTDQYFVKITQLSKPRRITCANSDNSADLIIRSMGDIVVQNNDTGMVSCLRNVLFAPGLVANLFSIRKLVSSNLGVEFTSSKLLIKDLSTSEVIKTGQFCGKFWWLSFSLPVTGAAPQMVLNNDAVITKEGSKSLLGKRRYSSQTHSLCLTNKDKGGSPPEGNPSNQGTYSLPAESGLQSNAERGASDVNAEDLQNLNAQRAQNLRDCVGYLWHLRLNHASLSYLRIAAKSMPELKGIKFGNDILDCEFCKMAKGRHLPCSEVRKRSDVPFSRLWSDLMGPIKPTALRTMSKYIVTFTDDCTRYVMAYALTNKTRVHIALQNCLEEIRQITQREAKVIQLCTDGGKEYQTYEMNAILKQERINLKICEPATPQHNGCSERLNLELQQKVRASLFAAKMPNYYWQHALNHVVHIHNRTPNRSIDFKSPYEMVKGVPPQLKHIKRFGCAAYYHDTHAKEKSKFAQRSNLAILMECNETGYTLLDTNKAIITRSKNVDFVESKVYGDFYGPEATLPIDEELGFGEPFAESAPSNQRPPESRNLTSTNEPTHDDVSGPAPHCLERQNDDSELDVHSENRTSSASENKEKSGELIGGTGQYDFFDDGNGIDDTEAHDFEANLAQLVEAFVAQIDEEPITYQDALARPDKDLWIEAIIDEFRALHKCHTWKIVPRGQVPPNLKVIKARWVHKRKQEVNGTVRYRSRLVAKGFADNNDYDRTEIYAPVARLADVRFMLIVANKLNLELVQFDIKTAFLNGTIERPVFMEVPEGLTDFLEKDEDFSQKYVCELKRALYGLKVSPKCWFLRFQAAMAKIGFVPYEYQQCIFVWKEGNGLAILLLYVDDILFGTNSKSKLQEVTCKLKQEFEVTELGEPRKFLGIEISRDRHQQRIFLHQRKFTEQIIRKFDSVNRKPVSSPMVPFDQRKPSSGKELNLEERKKIPYRKVIGSLLYLQNGTRPDIAYSTNVLSRRQSNFDLEDWNRVQRVITYLKGTKEMGLLYTGEDDSIDCYVDASLGTNDTAGHSTSGLIIKLFGDVVYWKTKKQNHVALSTAESEYVALSLACRELANVRAMSQSLIGVTLIPTIYEDSVAAIELAKTDESSALKHLVYLHYHYVRSEVKRKLVNVTWISTDQQLADVLTKALEPSRFVGFRDQIMQNPHK